MAPRALDRHLDAACSFGDQGAHRLKRPAHGTAHGTPEILPVFEGMIAGQCAYPGRHMLPAR